MSLENAETTQASLATTRPGVNESTVGDTQAKPVAGSCQEALEAFVKCAFDPNDMLEIRRLPSKRSTWHRAGDLPELAEMLLVDNATDSIYVGMNPRKGAGETDGEGVACARCHAVDFDKTTLDQALFKLRESSLPTPTLIFESGHGVHLWWRLNEPEYNLSSWTRRQKGLIARLGTDKRIHDPARILRLPGYFVNRKPDKPPVPTRLVEADPSRTYDVAEFEIEDELVDLHDELVVATEPRVIHDGEGRYDFIFKLACSLRSRNWPYDKALAHCLAKNTEMLRPPKTEDEVTAIVDDVYKRYPPGHGVQDPNDVESVSAWTVAGKLTELATAERMVAWYGREIRYTKALGWLHWTGIRWERDDRGVVMRVAQQTVRRLYRLAAQIEDKEVRQALVGWASKCESRSRLDNIVALAASAEGVAVRLEDFDKDPWALNVMNGTIDLRTGNLRPHDPVDLISKLSPVVYHPDATCPRFDLFLREVFDGDRALEGFSDRAIGHALTGVIQEAVLHILHGVGANGKSVLTELILHVLGDYGMTAPPGLLIARKHETHPTEYADLRGMRFVASMESGEGQRFDEERVKRLTGGDTIKGRFMHRDFFSFQPSHKLFMATNCRPNIAGDDHAVWRRPKLWPFTVVFTVPKDPAHPQPGEQDIHLLDTLKLEASGILARWVRGCLEWQRVGLAAPDSVIAATAGYREECDMIGQFLTDCCVTGPRHEEQAGNLYGMYSLWAEDNGLGVLSNVRFSKRLLIRDGVSRVGNTYRTYVGVALTSDSRQRLAAARQGIENHAGD